jgi:hypothetical protein
MLLADRKPDQRTFIRLHSAPLTTMMVATYVPSGGCTAKEGDLFSLMGIMNKQDYARWHSCEFVLGAKTFDPTLRPPGHPEARPLSCCSLGLPSRPAEAHHQSLLTQQNRLLGNV